MKEIKILLFAIILIFQIFNVNSSVIKRRGGRQTNVYERIVGEEVELVCKLSDTFGNEISWRKIDGVNWIIIQWIK